MRKILFTLVLAGAAVVAQAQVQFGPKVGLNGMTQSIGDADEEGLDRSPAIGFNAGMAFNIGISEKISFAPELIFTQKGEKYSYSESMTEDGETVSLDIKATPRYSYLEVPMLFRASLGQGQGLKAYVNAGPTFGYWLGGNIKSEMSASFGGVSMSESSTSKIKFVDEYSEDSEDAEILKDEANRFEIGAAIGGGLMLPPIAGQNFMVDIRYTMGLTDMGKDLEDGEKMRNNVISLSVIYLLKK